MLLLVLPPDASYLLAGWALRRSDDLLLPPEVLNDVDPPAELCLHLGVLGRVKSCGRHQLCW